MSKIVLDPLYATLNPYLAEESYRYLDLNSFAEVAQIRP